MKRYERNIPQTINYTYGESRWAVATTLILVVKNAMINQFPWEQLASILSRRYNFQHPFTPIPSPAETYIISIRKKKKSYSNFEPWIGGKVPFGEGLFMKFPWFFLVCLEITHNKSVSTPRTTTTSAEQIEFPDSKTWTDNVPVRRGSPVS